MSVPEGSFDLLLTLVCAFQCVDGEPYNTIIGTEIPETINNHLLLLE
jgi:hypothetical protein